MKKKFIETPTCQSRTHCHACVFNENGIREQWMKVFDWDGVCPLGLTKKNLRKKMPSILEQVKNGVKAIGRAAKALSKGEKVIATKRVQANRKKVCDSCDRLDKKSGRCSECGCQYEYKLATATEGCPIGKWKAIKNKRR